MTGGRRELAGATLLYGRCDPYGHESGGPRRMLGGLYGPEYEGRYKWTCERKAEGRYRMICQCGHVGQAMALCGPGTVTNKVSGLAYHHPGHVAQLSERASDLCPRCAFPPGAAELTQLADRAQHTVKTLESMGLGASPQAMRALKVMQSAQGRLDGLRLVGAIHNCRLKLVEVS